MDLYTWHTPNGKKPCILLAELDWSYTLKAIDISTGRQKAPDYLAINPNGKIPALVDGDVTVFESGAILEYLAMKSGRFLPRTFAARARCMSWLFWQVGGPGPFFGQIHKWKDKNPAAAAAFTTEAERLTGVLDRQLRNRDFICDEYTIADIACYPWFDALANMQPGIIDSCDAVVAWMDRMRQRPAVREGMALHEVRHAA